MISLCTPSQARTPTAVALGSFDGLHAGHKTVIKEITNCQNGIATVVSFWPHPREVLYGESKLRLDLPSEKVSLLKDLEVEQLVLVPFNKSLASLTAEDFFEEILLKKLQAKKIAVGENFRFGKNRKGNPSTLLKLCKEASVELSVVSILEDSQGRMSSSRIRSELKKGDINATNMLLGRPYNFRGVVKTGKGLGKKIGWPTANLEVDSKKLLPGLGVYVAWTKEVSEVQKHPSIMNLGPQPTIDPSAPSAVEVHLIDKEINLLGKELVVEPILKVRGQHKFKDLQELSYQINRDVDLARSIFKKL